MASAFGAPVRRREDRRLLTGRGRYVGDLELPRLLHVAFVRSTHAHARVRAVAAGAAAGHRGVAAVVTGRDAPVAGRGVRARSALPGYVETEQPLLAWPVVRHVGEALAVVVAADRYTAEDAAGLVAVEYEPRAAVVDVLEAARPGAPLVHEAARGNALLSRRFEHGDVEAALAASAVVVARDFRTSRQTAAPLEGRGGVADWNAAEGKLTLWAGTQVPHLARHLLAELLGLAENRVRVIAPDVGGGFGVKAIVYPEDAVLCLLAMHLGRPVKWVEQRRESMQASAHARDHHYAVRAGFDRDGRLRALDVRAACNAGAYSVYPWTAGLEALMAGGLLTGPYKLEHYRCDVTAVATHTTPAGPYRGVARPATTFVMERVLDLGARALGLDPVQIRRRNLVGAADLPYTSPTRLVHDSPSYPVCFDKAVEAVDYEGFRVEQARLRRAGRYVGVGFAVYNELTGLGQAASAGPRMPFRTGHEGATVRMDPSGAVTVLAGVTSQGQGLETTVAQLVASELTLPVEQVTVVLGDTDVTPFGLGAFASRQAVIGGGAALRAAGAVRDKVLRVAAHVLEAAVEDLDLVDGRVMVRGVPGRALALSEVARIAHLETQRLPPDLEPGLDATRFYDPIRGTFAAGAQAAIVEVEPETGALTIRRFVCVEDTGRVINPLIVEGQVHGAIAQGIGGALLEQVVYDPAGQLLTGTLMEYALPTAAAVPRLETDHIEEPAANLAGVRGVGEGGTLGPAAALANAVADALAAFGVEPVELPLTPARLWSACATAPPTASAPASGRRPRPSGSGRSARRTRGASRR
ncbi:MAG TPA: xanthine dehydrogenase family protein molybdopterin-binding subunit [Methylomirabilota bacterium]|nr:xanthine dehydrogenase family protein molybdopterin-binding subunit [Methylomirabilota bacterium]